MMVKLIDTYNVTKHRQIDAGTTSFWRIPMLGDGSCGLYALGAGILDSIMCGQLQLSEAKFAKWYRHARRSLPVLRERLKLYKNQPTTIVGNAYTDLAEPLERFMYLLESTPRLDFQSFKQFLVQQENRHAIAAILVAFAPSIRALAAEISLAQLEKPENQAIDSPLYRQEINDMSTDGVDVSEGLLSQVAKDFFEVNLVIYREMASGHLQRGQIYQLPNVPTVSIIHQTDHFDYLLPTTQRNGLACLPSFSEIENLFNIESKTQARLEEDIHAVLSQPTTKDWQIAFDELMAKALDNLYRTEQSKSDDELVSEARLLASKEMQKKFGLFKPKQAVIQPVVEFSTPKLT